jgi:hypothetical protein
MKRAAAQRVDSRPLVSLELLFTLLGFAVALFLVSAFGLDLAIGWPFRQASLLYDVNSVLSGIGLAYLSFDAYRDQVRYRR